jgi:hypothetical protein
MVKLRDAQYTSSQGPWVGDLWPVVLSMAWIYALRSAGGIKTCFVFFITGHCFYLGVFLFFLESAVP